MRTSILIALISICPHLYGQGIHDTIIHKRQLDSLQNLIFTFKDSTRRLFYEHKVFSYTTSIDTVFRSKDSLSILYKSQSGKVLKRIAQTGIHPDCIDLETTDYLNTHGLPEFTVIKGMSCLSKEEIEPGNRFIKLFYYYERRSYDSLDRLAVRIFWYPYKFVRRFEYHYNQKGEQSVSSRGIKAREFWD